MRLARGGTVRNPETGRLPVAGSISAWPVIHWSKHGGASKTPRSNRRGGSCRGYCNSFSMAVACPLVGSSLTAVLIAANGEGLITVSSICLA